MSKKHTWRFYRAGGLDQVRLDNADDLLNLPSLDKKLWVALSCPVKGLEFDEKTLAMIDTDGDGRVRVPEILGAIDFSKARLKSLDSIVAGGDSLALTALNDQTPEGKALIAAARQILGNLGKADATAVTLAEVADTATFLKQTKFNGDGIVPASAASDDATKAVIEEIIKTHGGETDRSGAPGVNTAKVDAFFAELTAFDAWVKKSESAAAEILPLGDKTAAASAAVKAVKAKVDDFFARCRLAAFDSRALTAVNRQEVEYLAIAAKDMTITADEVSGFPLARVEPGKALPLKDGVNPAWADKISAFQAAAVAPLLGAATTSLTVEQWTSLGAKLAAYDAWVGAKPATKIEGLGLDRIRALLAGPTKATLAELITQDKAVEADFNAIGQLEKTLRLTRDFHRLLLNFVSFKDFYDPDRAAIFQVGTLFLDARGCDLCVRVEDGGKHASLASLSKNYLAYCDLTRKGCEKFQIAAVFGNGDSDNLMVGRNGIFYDRKGQDWDATITKIIENPISVRQAFWAPYKKLVRLIEEQVAKRAAAADAEANDKIAAAAVATANADKHVAAAAKPAEKPEPKKIDVGTVAALGVAFGAIGTAFATLGGYLTGVLDRPFWQICLAVFGLLMLISGPSMLIAWLKLRQRNLGPILDANGWAVNGRVKVPVSLGRDLTKIAELPEGSIPTMDDKFAEPSPAWIGFVKPVLIICFLFSLALDFHVYQRVSALIKGEKQPDFTPATATVPATTTPPAAPAKAPAAPEAVK